jgi:hypothetical protein
MAKFEKLQRANVEVSNADEPSRKYAITTDAQIANGKVENFNNGQVKDGDVFVASFSRWSAQNLNVTFNNVEAEEQCAILAEINAFVESVEALAASHLLKV